MYWRRFSLGIVLASALGCSQEDADRVGQICQTAADKIETASGASGKVSTGWQALRATMSHTAADGRVVARMLWDQSLCEVEIQVQLVDRGTVRLMGNVTADQKRRAVEIAQTTQGVEKVVDELTVP